MHNPYNFCTKTVFCVTVLRKNIKIFGSAFKALLVMRIQHIFLTWVSKAISKANTRTDAIHIQNSGQILMHWM